MASLRCSICQREFQSEDSPAMPFCSDRCRLVDLGRWFDERYGMAVEPNDEDEEEEPQMNADEYE